ncbi:hypothetical protein QEH56_22310 [Pelagicoccus enzymogenes]|uniref:hypothetical protein n=1 Tax=Pelagicoccus enzymogenes TaxID=2773457 RepID=UPI00280D0DDD|nr:hypothetical protein [Pelagicoccus enzymogenes]MDQ8200917.1 hypothetical protein [Pelagicoccus enzymogenes]
MKSKRFLPLFAIAALSVNASNQSASSQPSLNYQILPLAIETDPESKDLLEDFFIENPVVKSEEPGIEYKVRIVTPDPNIDYKILTVSPKSDIDFKIRIIDPDTRKESKILTQQLQDELQQKLVPQPLPSDPSRESE